MPRLSVWVIRTALLYLGVGFTFGALTLSNKGVPYEPMLWRLLPLHIECLLFGWMVQLALGVAFWILPRLSGPHKRGRESLAWAGYGLLNAGIVVVSLGLWFTWPGAALFLGRLAEFGAVILFAIALWPRIKPFAS